MTLRLEMTVIMFLRYVSSCFPQQNHSKKTKCENLVTAMMADMTPGTRKFLNIHVVVMEILPPLMDIIQPNFRPVS